MKIMNITSSTMNTAQLRKKVFALTSCLTGAIILAGCASTDVSNQRLVYDRLPRPATIWVYDFGTSAADVPADSAFAGQASPPPTAQETALGRELGSTIAARLIEQIRDMGLPARQGVYGTSMLPNDIVLRGYIVAIEEGSAAKRMTIGFGSGKSELSTAVEGFQVTPQGLRKIGSGVLAAKGNKTPGASLGAASWIVTGNPVGFAVGGAAKIYGEASGNAGVEGRAKQTAKELAERLKVRFKEEGWIQ